MAAKRKYDVFISYRRVGGYDTAKHLNDLLVRDGYKVSFDLDTLRSGNFDDQLLARIEECRDFILIIDQHAFDRTLDKTFDPHNDWLRQELAHALKLNKNIIPIFLSGVTGFPDGLPDDIAAVALKNGPEYNKYYFNDFYKTLKDRFLHKPRSRGFMYVLLPVLLLLSVFLFRNQIFNGLGIADSADIIESNVDVSYYCKSQGEYDKLYAKVDGFEYKIDLPNDMCLDIIAQKDFDQDGIDDALVENIQACGGNAIGNSYFFVSYQGTGFFTVTNEFGTSVWEAPKIEKWKGAQSVVIIDNNSGFNDAAPYTVKERYILKQGKAVRVESAKKQEVSVLKEVRNSDFYDDTDPDRTIVMEYDINNDGREEQFHVRYWERWNAVLFELYIDGKMYECSSGDHRVGILSTTTNGYHDIVIGDNLVYKWNGRTYACGDDEFQY